MSESEPKKPTATSEPNQALPALARLLGRQAAREVVAQQWMTTGTETTTAVRLPDPAPVVISTSK